MIASQKIGKSFMGALNYNLKKLYHKDADKRAELLETNFTSPDLKQISREVAIIRELRPALNKYVYHTSLNFSKSEQATLDNEKLLAIAHDYLAQSGYTNNQYFIFRHYDAEHPHLHLLVNRIDFDGTVVSDSNNYKRSEAILKRLEEKYQLVRVEQSSKAKQSAPTKDELEMVMRTRRPSEKMVLQEKLKRLLDQKHTGIRTLIKQGEAEGIFFLFNQASTGRVSGITYCYKDFKTTGKALGNQFKWSVLSKQIHYEQIRDSAAVSEANDRTRAIYGDGTAIPKPVADSSRTTGSQGLRENDVRYSPVDKSQPTGTAGNTKEPGISAERTYPDRTSALETNQDAHLLDHDPAYINDDHHHRIDIEITDDVDDEAVYGRSRKKHRDTGYTR